MDISILTQIPSLSWTNTQSQLNPNTKTDHTTALL